jgi:hypothetical protein
MSKRSIFKNLERYAQEGVDALARATPQDTGLTATGWEYSIAETNGSYSITWTNRHVVGGVPLVILLQYGHGTGTGGYVHGVDFINPSIKPIFDKIADSVWKEVTSA